MKHESADRALGIYKRGSREIGFPKEFLFTLVKDVSSYPEFVPKCHKALIREGGDDHSFCADLTLGSGLFQVTYPSQVVCVQGESIRSTLIFESGGILEFLNSQWRFIQKTPDITVVHFEVHFKLQSALLTGLVGCKMDGLMVTMMDAFENRAQKLWCQYEKDQPL